MVNPGLAGCIPRSLGAHVTGILRYLPDTADPVGIVVQGDSSYAAGRAQYLVLQSGRHARVISQAVAGQPEGARGVMRPAHALSVLAPGNSAFDQDVSLDVLVGREPSLSHVLCDRIERELAVYLRRELPVYLSETLVQEA